jgi:RNA polymerase sigma-70 factor (ECF subfamily)
METEFQAKFDDGEVFVRYFSKYEGNVRAFVASLLHDWSAVDEVVQAASLVMWRKFDQFDRSGPESGFLNWAFMIARFEVLKYRSRIARDRLVFSDDVQQLLDAEAESVAATQSEREHALQDCLKKLKPAQRELIEATYGSGVSIKDASNTLGRTPTALYEALARIRDSLQICIERALTKTLTEEKT